MVGFPAAANAQYAQFARYVVIPGTGEKVVGDDFEDPKWHYYLQLPKSSRNLDNRVREPLGVSANRLWFESAKRGQPDVIRRVPTPAGGLKGSKGAMLIQTRQSGIPNYFNRVPQQDDLLFNNTYGAISVAWSPNVIVRLYVPPFERWEKNTGSTFGFRAALTAIVYQYKRKKRRFRIRRRSAKEEMFYPGLFIQFNSKADGAEKDSAHFIIRADDYGRDFLGPQITKTGWWTLGMSFTPDGHVHYFAKPGTGPLTMKDRIASSTYGGTRFQTFHTLFFDILSKNDGKSWSTPWIIDDVAVHLGARQSTATAQGNAQNR